ncbi:MAG: LON peptidase substrate-binding domain-containing protein [Pseudomonadota bacterium]
MSAETYRKLSDLPETMAVFPLSGAMLFPRWSLPLNIFEPRYLNMIDDAMHGHRMIGMAQTMGGDRTRPALANVGCAGRITSYSETSDGRYLISLTGICRFSTENEMDVTTPYRQLTPNWDPFEADLTPPKPGDLILSREKLTASLKRYSKIHTMEVDWDAVKNAPLETLIHALSAGCPFGVLEKQALLEAETISDRAETLMALLDMDVPGDDSSTLQ